MDKDSEDHIGRIKFSKYLNCWACRDVGLYCDEHRAEVEKILAENHSDEKYDI